MAESTCLPSRRAPCGYRGFESHPHRRDAHVAVFGTPALKRNSESVPREGGGSWYLVCTAVVAIQDFLSPWVGV